MAPPGKQELPISHDTEETQAVADAGRLVQAGVRTGDRVTQAAGVSRLIKQVGTAIPPEFAKSIGLDKVETTDD